MNAHPAPSAIIKSVRNFIIEAISNIILYQRDQDEKQYRNAHVTIEIVKNLNNLYVTLKNNDNTSYHSRYEINRALNISKLYIKDDLAQQFESLEIEFAGPLTMPSEFSYNSVDGVNSLYGIRKINGEWPSFEEVCNFFDGNDDGIKHPTLTSECRKLAAIAQSDHNSPNVNGKILGVKLKSGRSKLTKEYIESLVQSVHFFTAEDGVAGTCQVPPDNAHLVTICLLTMTGGHQIIGKSFCGTPSEYVPGDGNANALRDAHNQLWGIAYALETETTKQQ